MTSSHFSTKHLETHISNSNWKDKVQPHLKREKEELKGENSWEG
jgi:hypothetical protein